jgi:hypothetical protein
MWNELGVERDQKAEVWWILKVPKLEILNRLQALQRSDWLDGWLDFGREKEKFWTCTVQIKRQDKMVAPTAVLKPQLPEVDTVDEEGTSISICLLIPVMINPTEVTIPADPPVAEEMHIDEESRPHFPASSQSVLPP